MAGDSMQKAAGEGAGTITGHPGIKMPRSNDRGSMAAPGYALRPMQFRSSNEATSRFVKLASPAPSQTRGS